MPTGAELFAAPAAAPEAASTAAPGTITGASLFGGPNAQEQETSPLARNRAALPKAAQEKTGPSSATETVGAPSPADIQRNAEDFGRGLERQIGLLARAAGKAAAGAVSGLESVLPIDTPASILARRLAIQKAGGKPQAEDLLSPLSAGRMIEREVEAHTPKPATGLERGVEKVTEFAAGVAMPGLPGAKVPGITPMTNNMPGLSLSSAGTAKAGDAIKALSDDLYKIGRIGYLQFNRWFKDIAAYKPEGYEKMAPRVSDYLDEMAVYGKSSITLSPEETKVVEWAKAGNRKNELMRGRIGKLGFDIGKDEPGYIGARLAVGKPSLLETVMSSAPVGKPRGLKTMVPEFRSRVAYGLEGGGEKNLHVVDNENGTFTVWRNKEKIAGGKFDPEELARGEISFKSPSTQKAAYGAETKEAQTFKIVPSTKRAIETHTGIEYRHDPLLSIMTSNIRLTNALNAAEFINKLKFTPDLAKFRAEPGKDFPAGWREVNLKQLNGFKFDPKVAEVIDDFTQAAQSGGYDAINNLSRMVVGSMFWTPLPHEFNVNTFALLEQGLVGTLTKLGHPVDELNMMLKAHKEVINLGPDFTRAVKEGAGLQSTAITINEFVAKTAKALGTNPEMTAAAKAWGYANPAHMWQRVMEFSKNHLWAWNDTLLMHGYYSRMAKGQQMPEAIKNVESIIPNYRIPSRLWQGPGGRTAQQIFQVLPTFPRYHWGILKAYGNIAKNIVTGDAKTKLTNLDRLAMLALGSAVVYPAMDHALQLITGNDQARFRRYGPFAPIDAVYRFTVGDARYATLSSALLGVSPVFSVPAALAEGRDPFTGKAFEGIGDVIKFAAEQFNPIQTVAQYEGVGGRKTGGEILMEQLGVQLPSLAETNAREKAQVREEKKREKEE